MCAYGATRDPHAVVSDTGSAKRVNIGTPHRECVFISRLHDLTTVKLHCISHNFTLHALRTTWGSKYFPTRLQRSV